MQPLNQQIGRFLRQQAKCESTWHNTPEGYRAYERYRNLNALAELFYSWYDQREDDEQAEFNALIEEDFENYARGIR